jgi:hypothetical protein
VLRLCTTESSARPSPNVEASTAAVAVSSVTRGWRARRWTANSARSAVAAAPAMRRSGERPGSPSAEPRMKAAATPGSVAWATASETSERRLSMVKTPTLPAAMPSAAAPSMTTVVL